MCTVYMHRTESTWMVRFIWVDMCVCVCIYAQKCISIITRQLRASLDADIHKKCEGSILFFVFVDAEFISLCCV